VAVEMVTYSLGYK